MSIYLPSDDDAEAAPEETTAPTPASTDEGAAGPDYPPAGAAARAARAFSFDPELDEWLGEGTAADENPDSSASSAGEGDTSGVGIPASGISPGGSPITSPFTNGTATDSVTLARDANTSVRDAGGGGKSQFSPKNYAGPSQSSLVKAGNFFASSVPAEARSVSTDTAGTVQLAAAAATTQDQAGSKSGDTSPGGSPSQSTSPAPPFCADTASQEQLEAQMRAVMARNGSLEEFAPLWDAWVGHRVEQLVGKNPSFITGFGAEERAKNELRWKLFHNPGTEAKIATMGGGVFGGDAGPVIANTILGLPGLRNPSGPPIPVEPSPPVSKPAVPASQPGVPLEPPAVSPSVGTGKSPAQTVNPVGNTGPVRAPSEPAVPGNSTSGNAEPPAPLPGRPGLFDVTPAEPTSPPQSSRLPPSFSFEGSGKPTPDGGPKGTNFSFDSDASNAKSAAPAPQPEKPGPPQGQPPVPSDQPTSPPTKPAVPSNQSSPASTGSAAPPEIKLNLGGEGERAGYIDVNPLIGNRRTKEEIIAKNPTGGFLQAGAEEIADHFLPNSVSDIQSQKLPGPVITRNARELAEHIATVLKPGASVTLHSSSPVMDAIRKPLEQQGLKITNFHPKQIEAKKPAN